MNRILPSWPDEASQQRTLVCSWRTSLQERHILADVFTTKEGAMKEIGDTELCKQGSSHPFLTTFSVWHIWLMRSYSLDVGFE